MTDINSVQFSEYLKNALEKQLVLLSYCAWQATILCELYTYCYGTDGVIDRRDEESTNTERHRARMIAPRGGFPEFRWNDSNFRQAAPQSLLKFPNVFLNDAKHPSATNMDTCSLLNYQQWHSGCLAFELFREKYREIISFPDTCINACLSLSYFTEELTFICISYTSIKFLYFFVSIEVTTKGPQNVVRKNFHSSKEMLVEFGEAPRSSSPAAHFKHQPGRYIFLKCMAEFAISSNMLSQAILLG